MTRCSFPRLLLALSAVGMSATFYPPARAEVILQYFSTSWNEIAERMPELAEAGYTALWLPPPFKAGGGTYDVGFGTFDRFDLGDKHQMGTIRTRYGTTDELLNMIKIAHRFGLRVYFDNVMAHNGGPLPGYDEHTPITAQPGFLPEDFHLVTRSDGTYRRAPYADDIDYQNEWQVLYRNPFGLDIALENEGGDNMNRSFGPYEGNFFPKYFGIRHPSNPEFYPDLDLPVATNHQGQVVYTFADKEPYQDIGCATCPAGSAGNLRFDFNDANGNGQHDAGEASEPFADTGIDPSTPDRRVAGWGYGNGRYDMGNPTSEDVNSMLMRAARWFVDKARIDGFRLDAVKHVPFYFFGKTSGSDKDYVNWGYSGAIQEQFNVTHGYSDWSNHRNSCYNDRIPRDDALLYGEHLGSPPYEGNYLDAGMRIANDNVLNGIKGNVGGNLSGMDQPGWASLGVDVSMMYVMSHDNNYLYGGDRPSAHALILTRAGLPIVYTDGYHQSGPPDWFPKPAYLPFLGQFDSKYLPNLLYIHNHFARGDQIPKWGNQDFVAYERRDKRENAGMSDADGTVLLFGMARGYQPIGQNLNVFQTTFPEGARLYNYSFHGGGFYAQVSEGRVNAIVPPGGYFAFSWRSPEESQLWKGFGGKPLTIYENGREAGAVAVERRDGPDGDPAFNPHGLADNVTTDYTYTIHLPRVTVATNLRFVARVDGSAADVRFKLDGGVDLNAQMGIGSTNPPARDAPPGATTDTFLGYEFSRFVNRQYPEKFAAADSARDKIGSAGAETYIKTVGTAGYTRNDSDGVNDWSNTYTPSWVWHDPTNFVNAVGIPTTNRHFQTDAGTTFTLWVKMGSACNANRMFLYYTTDGATWPEGAGGEGAGNTRVLPFQFTASDRSDGSLDWWSATVTNLIGGTPLRYKIGAVRMQGTNYACGVGADIPFPFGESDIARKTAMLGVWEITNFNSATVFHKPHNDHGVSETGLEEGFHALSARAYLQRDGRAAIYNTFPRTFYLDTAAPTGRIVYPAADGETLYGSQYGVRVRADRTVKEVLYRILDSRPDNDDSATGVSQGNGAWVRAIEVSPDQAINSPFPRQWNFDYVNIAPTGTAQIAMRLREISSSTNMALSDAEGHFTTLIRGVETRGPDYRLFVAWPPSDGQVVGAGYVLKAYFTKALADNASAEQMVDWFTLNADGEFQPRSGYSISYNETLDYHALAWTIPNLYNGVPDEQHLIEITLARTNYPILTATRRVRAQPVTIPFLKIVSPPAAGDDGQSYVIRLPDVASPTVTQRQYLVQVESGSEASNVTVFFSQGTGALIPDANNPTNLGNGKLWNFTWQFPVTNEATLIEGLFQLRADLDTNADTNTVEAYALRDTRVVLRETVPVSLTDDDDDDDGLFDIDETTPASLPGTPFTEWDNGDVHRYTIYGRTDFLSPDADGDGLPDGLELGWRNPINSNTVTTTDTDGDGYPNFIGDRDPPFFNTAENYGRVPGVALADQGNKTDLKAGTMTDPNNPDSDFDGLPDGLEDLNRNGWVDGDGADLPLDYEPWLGRNWPDRSRDGGDVWLETDPNNADTDKDGLSDGYGEDKDGDGRIGGDANSNRVYDAGEAWTETDPLETDTDGDTLPDGWESLYALDPLNNGTDSLRTADAADGNPDHGAGGDPDGDGANNLAELISGTDPRAPNSGIPPPPGAIVIGPGSNITVGAVANNNEFTDWKYTDLIALDPPDSLEGPFNGGDVYYRPWASDGLENSRDLVAFYARDGGSVSNGGDGKFYFRVDLHNLQAHAEDSGLDVYVVVDTGNTAIGERKMVDEVDVLTDMRWEAVVALYDGNSGRVYVNTPGSPDTSSLSDTLVISPTDVQMRTRADPDGFKQAHYSAELDAVEFSISRNALTAAGWSGDPSQLRYQVFTTRDGTGNSPRGPGDLDGPDIADSIRTDWIAEDFAGTGRNKDAAYADQLRYESRVALTTLSQWVGVNADNDRGKRVKVISIVHANQALQPGSAMQNLIDNGAGAGYYRPLDAHQAHGVPMTLHMTPTMASAIEWAAVDTNAGPAYRDGPAFNARLRQMMAAGTVQLLGTTFSDHLLPYFTSEFNEDNLALANEFLRAFYGTNAVSAKTFWTPERLLDHDVLAKVAQLGFSYTFCDQMLHLRQWFGFSSAVGVDGYRIHRVNNVNLIPISDLFYQPQFSQTDSGPSLAFREQLNKTARNGAWNGQHPQVMTLMSNWENFGENSKADAYDRNIRWLASRGWIQFITPDQIANNQIDISTPPDAVPDAWNRADHGTVPSLAKVAHDWLHYAAQGNYDNWYVGAWNEEGLESRYFEVRPGTSVGQRYGMLYTGGMVSGAWATVSAMTDSNLARLGRATLHASVLLSGFHDQPAANLTKFSTGQYVYPDASSNRLAFFARSAQAQTRTAALFERVEDWARTVTNGLPPATDVEDADADGEGEYFLYNDRLFAAFERVGGRMIGAWVRDVLDGRVYQAVGNQVGYAGSETEYEGAYNVQSNGTIGAYRTSGLKDWYGTVGGDIYNNMLYTMADLTNGWRMVSANGAITKSVTLAARSSAFEVQYSADGPLANQPLYVRHGLSPNLYQLLLTGQRALGPAVVDGGVVSVSETNYATTVQSFIGYADAANHGVGFNEGAVDDNPGQGPVFGTVNMRNQAQTHQVELVGTNAFAFSLGFRAYPSDWDQDGLPNTYEDQQGFSATNAADGAMDGDEDGVINADEYVAGTAHNDGGDYLSAVETRHQTNGIVVRFRSELNRRYFLSYSDVGLMAPRWAPATPEGLDGNGGTIQWLDDGTRTAPHPFSVSNRTYRVGVRLP